MMLDPQLDLFGLQGSMGSWAESLMYVAEPRYPRFKKPFLLSRRPEERSLYTDTSRMQTPFQNLSTMAVVFCTLSSLFGECTGKRLSDYP